MSTLPFAVTIFLSAFLLFQIQPIITRHILPWFGGTPSVWSAALLFFQTLLLAGYSYAHRLSTGTPLTSSRRKVVLHSSLLMAAVFGLLISAYAWDAPLLPSSFWKPPDSSQPLLRIMVVLLISVGLPYFVLSTTSPLLQAWFYIVSPTRSPYWLYALSNLGSFLALISYPFIFEIFLDLPQQTMMWSAGFLLYIGLNFFLFLKLLKMPAVAVKPDEVILGRTNSSVEADQPRFLKRLLWLLIPACTSVLLMAVTSYLTQEVAVIPFLWVLPLGIYLLSFTITFSEVSVYRPLISVILLGIAVLLVSYTVVSQEKVGIFAQVIAGCFFLFMATVVGHGELYRLRPSSDRLTSFYLMVSLGGVIGGLFVNLVAPVIFSWYWELPLGVLTCWLLVAALLILNRESFLWKRSGWIVSPILLGVLVTSGLLFLRDYQSTRAAALIMQRNFYGVFRVRLVKIGDPPQDAYSLSHGITSHGFQFVETDQRKVPTSYYGPKSGIGLAIRYFQKSLPVKERLRSLKVGVVGLGAGTIAAYGTNGDVYRFYEINPDIILLAEGHQGYFSYLEDSLAEIEIVPGDARVTLEHELAKRTPQNFDILAIDAFSGDSIPVHLLTVEAFESYLGHLKPDGVLAVHISNRYLDLEPLIQTVAKQLGLDAVLISSVRTGTGSYPAVWVLLTKNLKFLELYEIRDNVDPWHEDDRTVRLWTDAYSNLFQFLRLGGVFDLK